MSLSTASEPVVPGALALGIDTAGPVVGLALWAAGSSAPLAHRSARAVRGADGIIATALSELLRIADASPPGLRRVAVTVGPGAFTGLRVGVATALGLALSRDLPVVGISSLRARAALVTAPVVLSLLDGRRDKVYCCSYDTGVFPPRPLSDERDIPLTQACPAAPFLAVGEGASVYREAIVAAGGVLAQDPTRSCAAQVARLAWAVDAPLHDPLSVRLNYIRPPDARLPHAKLVPGQVQR